MRGRLLGAVLASASFMSLAGTAHAGYASFEAKGGTGWDGLARFDAQPHEFSNVRYEVTDGGRTVTFTDLGNPITVGAPPTVPGATPCVKVSTHVARCTGGDFMAVRVQTGLQPAQIRDLPGDTEPQVEIFSGPRGDDIAIDDQLVLELVDEGGANQIKLGDWCPGCVTGGQTISLGPGASQVDMRNGAPDSLTCGAAPASQFTGMSIRALPADPLVTVLSDPGDDVTGCEIPDAPTDPPTAGNAYMYFDSEGLFGEVNFVPLAGQSPKLRVQVLDGGATVTIEDLATPLSPEPPFDPTDSNGGVACEALSTHKVRCTDPYGSPSAFDAVSVSLFSPERLPPVAGNAAEVRDLPGSGSVPIIVDAGPLGDVIDLRHGRFHYVRDAGGANRITLGAPDSGWENGIEVGPGLSQIDVQNGGFDLVECLADPSLPGFGHPEVPGYGQVDPELGAGAVNALDTVSADSGDQVIDCD